MLGGCVALFLGAVSPLWGRNRPLPTAGARAMALGGAYSAEDQDVNALFYNPAGLTGLTGSQMSLNYGRLNVGTLNTTSEIHGAFGMPASFQGRPIGAAGGFLAQSLAPGAHVFDLYSGFGMDVPTRGRVPWPVRGGGVLKIRQQNGDEKDDAVGKTKVGFGLDGGALVQFNEDFTLGFVLRDLFPSGVNPPGPQLRLGGKYRYVQKVILLSDLEVRRNVTALHFGAEWLFYRDLLRLRIGNSFRANSANHIALGAGFNFSPAQIDVAYAVPTEDFNEPSDQFRITLIYRFNAPRFSELYFDRALDMADEVDRRVAQLEEKESQLKTSVQDLEQARRLAEEELARVSVRRAEGQRDVEERILQAETRASEAERRAADLEDKVRVSEEKIRRAERLTAPRPASTEKPKPKIRTHVVQPGDSLRSLAAKYYNDPERWKTIFNANPKKVDRGRLLPGAELVIPE
ncbi:MAG TPA: LysM peptidoglycan-binding domain-containing protein [Elusimicrobiota bacterium]|nr:LysM peptidoglycan-binding domain-containing protein [Elusimicrobiota bacterium]